MERLIRSTVSAGGENVGIEPHPVRARRNNGTRGPVVAVTGAASVLGRRVAQGLAARADVHRVIAVDRERGDVTGVTWRVIDLADPAVVTRLTGADVVVHAALDLNITGDVPARSHRNVRGTQTVLTASAAAGVRHVVVVSSAMAYGAVEDNPVPLDEDAPLRAPADGGLISDLLEIEALCARSRRAHPGMPVTVVRPATLVGPGIDTVLTRHFEAPRLLVLKGSVPTWQFCHIDDLASALEFIALRQVDGPVAVASPGYLDQEEVEALSGLGRVELSSSFATGTAGRLHRLGVIQAPVSELQFVTHPWAVAPNRLTAAGWQPEFTNELALQALMELVTGRHALASRRIGRRGATATIGAAGATVAILGTAVVVRKARKRKRG
ncbi:NAD-dependent epimerase/dehydratase family protein [Phytoactinopolyspora mesophila]|uniref:NAD-dependent epimerase/dehydratase family protein n=1 Tax=Phytoactinopolyspora mesophila TaxID=2650750 RepID=A0A7K3MCW6_9ACTN|nr:NAD-dependent epimerase/dehydratase family protein [Phytoactinopolyspora mesophila]NDL61046.1 NAD-dependent epimerase/dehydratase family protein [Phytoactinopolyspora mesophila]